MRKLIAGMQISLDGKVEGSEGYADWVHEWSDNYGLIPMPGWWMNSGSLFIR